MSTHLAPRSALGSLCCAALLTVTAANLLTTAAAAAVKPKAVPADKAAQGITASALREHVRALTDDKTAGRQPGTPGEAEVHRYLSEQLQKAGLTAAGDSGSFLAALTLTGVRSRLMGAPTFRSLSTSIPVQIAVGSGDLALQATEATASSMVRESEMVFVGYGITAPEFQWDDYKGVDLHGKVVMLLDGDPQNSPTLFAGKAQLHHGRWPLKLAEVARRGAVAALVIHDPTVTGAKFAVRAAQWTGEHYMATAAAAAAPSGLVMRGVLSEDACRRIMQAGGQDYDMVRKAAEDRSFNPITLPVRMSARLQNQTRPVTTGNVLGLIAGTDPRARSEAVVITAHTDGLGTRAEESGPGKIYRGAHDNAAGVAALLEMARAARLGPPPRRTLVFAALTAQGSDFLGARHLLAHLPAPASKAIAHLNLDVPATGPARTQAVQIGRGKSSLDALLDATAKLHKRHIVGDASPQLGLLYRSDSLPFAEAGIPSLFLGAADVERFLSERFQQPSDTLSDALQLDATAEDAQLLYLTALRIADSKLPPKWNPGDEFTRKP